MGATIGGAFGSLVTAVHPAEGVTAATGAIIGMAAMVGGGTGAAMTAVTMIFEMTRDYDLVMPSIVAVALAIGVRRLLSPENIYTIKLVGRGHFVPKALHANMFLVRSASEVMERDLTILPAEADFDAFLRQHATGRGFKHVVVTRGITLSESFVSIPACAAGLRLPIPGSRWAMWHNVILRSRARTT